MLGDGTHAQAKVVAIYKRAARLRRGAARAGARRRPRRQPAASARSSSQADDAAAVAAGLRRLAARYPGLRVQRQRGADRAPTTLDRETNRWLGPLFVAIIFAFTSIAVVNTLVMIALRRGRELALLRLSGATRRQVRSMARWEAALIVAIGLGVGLAIAATALLPLSHALTGSLKPTVPAGSARSDPRDLGPARLLALSMPTRRVLRARPIQAVGSAE